MYVVIGKPTAQCRRDGSLYGETILVIDGDSSINITENNVLDYKSALFFADYKEAQETARFFATHQGYYPYRLWNYKVKNIPDTWMIEIYYSLYGDFRTIEHKLCNFQNEIRRLLD